MEHFDELTGPPVVGRTYLARCVFVPGRIGKSHRGLWWPVHGAVHTDAEIGTPSKHYHLAIPLLSLHQAGAITAEAKHLSIAWSYSKIATVRGSGDRHGNEYESNFTEEATLRRAALRPWPTWPAVAAGRVTSTLERLYPQPLPTSMRCPHRGINLAAVPVRDGVITCPGHGLSWCAATGRPVCAVDRKYRDC